MEKEISCNRNDNNAILPLKKNNNVLMRALTTGIGIPISSIILFTSLKNDFLITNAIILLLTFCMVLETHKLLPKKMRPNKILSFVIGILFPLSAMVERYSPELSEFLYLYTIKSHIPVLFLITFSSIFIFKKNTTGIIFTLGGILFILFYPGLFAYYLILLSTLPSPEGFYQLYHVIMPIGIAFSNDGFAYIIGKLFGKNKNIVKVSPQKTLQGFIGGTLGGIVYFYILNFINPSVYSSHEAIVVFVFAIILNLSGILGDLFESAIKRGSNCENSGVIIPGRGGALDTFDSLLFIGPVYFFLYPILFL